MNTIDSFFTEDFSAFAQKYYQYLNKILYDIDKNQLQEFIDILISVRSLSNKIFFIGNGGSAATSSHFANDLSVGVVSEKPFKAISLTDNQAVITAIANDYGYEFIFSKQIEVVGDEGDILVGISASGNSQNIINAFEVAKKMSIKTIAITAFDGGRMSKIADQILHVPTGLKEYGPAEDAHMIIDHLVSSYLIRMVKHGYL